MLSVFFSGRSRMHFPFGFGSDGFFHCESELTLFDFRGVSHALFTDGAVW